jgi:hypothetical protein
MFKFKITPDHHNAIQNLNYYVLPDPPLFSLPSTFKELVPKYFVQNHQTLLVSKGTGSLLNGINYTSIDSYELAKHI